MKTMKRLLTMFAVMMASSGCDFSRGLSGHSQRFAGVTVNLKSPKGATTVYGLVNGRPVPRFILYFSTDNISMTGGTSYLRSHDSYGESYLTSAGTRFSWECSIRERTVNMDGTTYDLEKGGVFIWRGGSNIIQVPHTVTDDVGMGKKPDEEVEKALAREIRVLAEHNAQIADFLDE